MTPARRPATPARSFLGEARFGRALTPTSLAEPREADPRETREGLSPGGWVSARPRTAARGPRPADFLKGERTQSHPWNWCKVPIPGPCSLRCCYIRSGVSPSNVFFFNNLNLFLVAQGLRCRLSLAAVSGATLLFGAWAPGAPTSAVATPGLSSCGAWA